MRFRAAVLVLVAVAFALCGCTTPPPNDATPAKTVRALQRQAAGLENLLVAMSPATDPEPRGDTGGGTYLCRVASVSTGTATSAVVIDIVTDEFPPGTTVQDRERSSWPDRLGWNKYQHRQMLTIDRDAVLAVTDNSHDLRVVSSAEFAAWRKGARDSDGKFYVEFSGGSVSKLWSWTY